MIANPRRFSWIIFGSLVAGAIVGLLLHAFAPPDLMAALEIAFRTAGTVFLNLVKMVVAPLIFATLVSGLASFGDTGAIGRIVTKSLVWFLGASIVSLALGTVMALLLQPGAGLSIPLPPDSASAGVTGKLTVESAITGAFPTSVIDAMARNNILQIVVFSLFAGLGLAAMGERGEILRRGVSELAELMLKITGYVMLLAPIGVFAAVAGAIAKEGFDVLAALGALVLGYYACLVVLVAILVLIAWRLVGGRLAEFLKHLREPALIAFSTSSSEAAYPRVLAALEDFGAPRRISGLVLPLGYSFNLDASMVYLTFASLFIAQAYGLHLAGADVLLMMLTLMLASKGIAAVPRGSLIALAAVLPHFGMPESGLLLLLGVDHLLNMGRSGVNVLGNAVAVTAVAKWEGDPLVREKPASAEA
ncbi:MAG: dicarboxylate/amino acid:cation symporter [Phenylobacterium sp.]|nr:dicarboxylate/amino acid:cation symporter [Phenylobacterium sp.]